MADEPVTQLLAASRAGERGAMDRVFAAVYGELHGLAHRQRARSRPGDTLSTTVLVHEAFLKLSQGAPVAVQDRQHFFALAARAMRQILVDAARARVAGKRGGGVVPVEFLEADASVDAVAVDVVALDRALDRLEAVDAQLARLVEGRFFAGLTDAELALALGRNERTVRRDWQRARAFLLRELAGAGAGNEG